MSHAAPPLLRRAAALIAVLLLLFPSVGEALGHACPHHAPDGGAHAEAEAHGGHHDGGAPEHGGHQGTCTCVGTCQASTLPGLPPEGASALPFTASAPAVFDVPQDAARVRHPPFFLPYGLAPPARR